MQITNIYLCSFTYGFGIIICFSFHFNDWKGYHLRSILEYCYEILFPTKFPHFTCMTCCFWFVLLIRKKGLLLVMDVRPICDRLVYTGFLVNFSHFNYVLRNLLRSDSLLLLHVNLGLVYQTCVTFYK